LVAGSSQTGSVVPALFMLPLFSRG